MKTPFVWIGAKRAAKRGVGQEAANLDYAAKMGLPVPPGAILLHEFYQLLLDEGLIHWHDAAVQADDPQEIYDALFTAVRFPQLDKPANLRPAFAAESHSVTLTGVNIQNAFELSQSLCRIWSIKPASADMSRRDLLIQEMIAPDVVGTVQPSNTDIDRVCFKIDKREAHINLLPLGRWQPANAELPPFAQRLQKLMRGIRRTFGPEIREIGWLDDGRICWIDHIQL